MRALKKFFEAFEEEEYTDGDVMFIEICLTFGCVFFLLAELSRVVIG